MQWLTSSVLVCSLNLALLLACLVKMLMFGDPSFPAKSQASLRFWRHRRQADFDLHKVSWRSYVYII
jgi:hypothetical protein